jgi:8-oxo-dGTP diphosphatase
MDNYQEYVAGFLLSELNGSLLLVRKTKPVWQAGKLNGIGGKVEPEGANLEPYDAAMQREWNEETGGSIAPEYGWTQFATIVFPRARVHFFRGTTKQNVCLLDGVLNDVGERLECVPLHGIADRTDMIHNLRWLIPLAFHDPAPGMKTTDGEWREIRSW